jgi:hypothetical protein
MDFSLTQNPNTEIVTKDLPPFLTAAAKDDDLSAAAANTGNNNGNKDISNVAGKQVVDHHTDTDTEVNTIVTGTNEKTE